MKTRSIFSLIAIVLAVSLLTGTVSAAKVTLSDVKVNGPGEQATVHLILDEAPDGLAGYGVNISFDPGIVKIVKVDFPSWALLKIAKGIDEDNELLLIATDPKNNVRSGAKNIELATITIEGLNKGSTYLHREKFDDHKEQHMTLTLSDGSFTVGDVPVTTYKPTTAVTPQKTLSGNPTPEVTGQLPARKVTYSATGPVVPIVGIILSIALIGIGGYLRRR